MQSSPGVPRRMDIEAKSDRCQFVGKIAGAQKIAALALQFRENDDCDRCCGFFGWKWT